MTVQPPSTSGSNALQLIKADLSKLRLPKRELRNHPAEQVRKIARSLETFGWVSPILVSSDLEVIAGTARVKAARSLGMTNAPALRVDHLTQEQIRLYRIADNRLAEDADWDKQELRNEIGELIALDLDVNLTGFETGEIDVLLDFDDDAEEDRPERGQREDKHPSSTVGEVYNIGDHMLICGDALEPETWKLLAGRAIHAGFVDSPYNVPIDKHVSGKGEVKHREFVQASGEISADEFQRFLVTVHQHLATAMNPGAILFSCMDWRSIDRLVDAGKTAGMEHINMVVWDKMAGGMGALYRSQHELISVFKKPGGPHRNNVQLGKHGRNRTNVWAYAGMNTGGKDRKELLALHPTVKPVELVADAIKDVTAHGETVIDCFGGSGTTMLAAHKTGRKAILIELDPVYVDTIIARMEKATGLKAERIQDSSEG